MEKFARLEVGKLYRAKRTAFSFVDVPDILGVIVRKKEPTGPSNHSEPSVIMRLQDGSEKEVLILDYFFNEVPTPNPSYTQSFGVPKTTPRSQH